jgi:lipoprotein LprG
MRSIRRPRYRFVALAVALSALLAGCSQDRTSDSLPDGRSLLVQSSDAMDEVTSVRFSLRVEADRPSNFQISEADGVITADGGVSAAAKVLQAGTLVEYEYIVAGNVPYLKGPTGGFRQVPEAIYNRIFNPSGLLSGERSLPNALREVTEATTEDTEEVDGVSTYRIKGDLDPRNVEGLSLLASGAEGETTMWVDRESKRLVRASLPFELSGREEKTVVTVTLSGFNEPADIKAPV